MTRACVIGWPIKHSRSPLIHNYWLKQHGLAGSYEKISVAPDDLEAFIAKIGVDYAGCNVTVPHKERVMALVDEAEPVARAVGAVNTVWFEGGLRRGTNTDVEGFLANLDHGAPGWDRAVLRAVVLGAGGAARAVIYGLLQRGAETVVIVNRTPERARDLAGAFGPACIAVSYADLATHLASASLFVNATSLGMQGSPPLDIDLSPLKAGAVVNDLVYAPLRTALLEDARRRGARTVDGLGMLLHQAVPGFEKWFGVRPEVTPELRALVEADLRGETA